ncbi:hypothetical protein AgCh_024118 [Apium graveolens]
MNKTKLPIRKRLGNVPQFSGSVDAAVAEYRVVDYLLRLGVIKGNGTRDNPDPRSRIWGCYTVPVNGLTCSKNFTSRVLGKASLYGALDTGAVLGANSIANSISLSGGNPGLVAVVGKVSGLTTPIAFQRGSCLATHSKVPPFTGLTLRYWGMGLAMKCFPRLSAALANTFTWGFSEFGASCRLGHHSPDEPAWKAPVPGSYSLASYLPLPIFLFLTLCSLPASTIEAFCTKVA